MLFPKRELCLTQSLRAQSEIRKILNENGIKYDVTTIDRNNIMSNLSFSRGYRSSVIYKFAVSKKDYDKALNLIRHIRLND